MEFLNPGLKVRSSRFAPNISDSYTPSGFSASPAELSRVFEIHDGEVRGNLFSNFEVVRGIPADYLRNNLGRRWGRDIIENVKLLFERRDLERILSRARASTGFYILIPARNDNTYFDTELIPSDSRSEWWFAS